MFYLFSIHKTNIYLKIDLEFKNLYSFESGLAY
jgi:hypothetical protein